MRWPGARSSQGRAQWARRSEPLTARTTGLGSTQRERGHPLKSRNSLFRKHILPPLRDYVGVLHRKGKYLMTHTDGENRLLLPLYQEAGFDIADSLCPYPMTRSSLEEIRAAFADRITIW